MRVVGTISAALVVLAVAIASPAQAAIQIDLTINFIPTEPIFPGGIAGPPILPQQLTGVPFFTIPAQGGAYRCEPSLCRRV
jgi:hypothetical protein